MSLFACGGTSTKGCVGMNERLGWRGWLTVVVVLPWPQVGDWEDDVERVGGRKDRREA